MIAAVMKAFNGFELPAIPQYRRIAPPETKAKFNWSLTMMKMVIKNKISAFNINKNYSTFYIKGQYSYLTAGSASAALLSGPAQRSLTLTASIPAESLYRSSTSKASAISLPP
jgi:hypothetical protein